MAGTSHRWSQHLNKHFISLEPGEKWSRLWGNINEYGESSLNPASYVRRLHKNKLCSLFLKGPLLISCSALPALVDL